MKFLAVAGVRLAAVLSRHPQQKYRTISFYTSPAYILNRQQLAIPECVPSRRKVPVAVYSYAGGIPFPKRYPSEIGSNMSGIYNRFRGAGSYKNPYSRAGNTKDAVRIEYQENIFQGLDGIVYI